ncbi:hypothetical protein COO60DRAFT_1700595 [Scenedesmus sp. NREL 46B-D3]|nr:hypothetical protein COO60DRAFT_1700595 [Scenedesmus sp. NREL 46B-D3]
MAHTVPLSMHGPLPDSLTKLKKLQWLMLEHNQLTGPLPAYLGQLPQLQRVLLQHNSLAGPVPISLCSGSASYDLASNVGLIWTPKYWTSQSIVAFNFTGFMDYESGISRYQWGIGSSQFAANVVPLSSVTGERLLKDIRYSGGTKKMYDFQQASTTKQVFSLQASWDNFTDPQSGVVGYTVQFFQQVRSSKNGTIELTTLTEPLSVGLANRVQMLVSQLQENLMYYAQVTAINAAGLTTTVNGLPITVDKSLTGGVPPGMAALIAVMCSLGCLGIGAVMAVVIMRGTVDQQKQREKERQNEYKQLKALMYALVSHSDGSSGGTDGMLQPARGLKAENKDKEVAFVFTDIESSTELSNQDGKAFKQLQEVHDQIMREGIAKHHGYEIITEGDSFQVAFDTCQAALAFCVDIQYRFLEQTWSKEVLRLNACKVVRGPDGAVLFAGPRVRMGIHYAREGTVAVRLHNLTRHKVYAGPAVQIALDVSEVANGGQIVLTEDAVAKLSENMALAGFPVIRMAGLFQLPCVPCPVFLYSVVEAVGRPLRRTFAGLRKIKNIWPQPPEMQLPATLQYNINLPPLPVANNALAFVALRLATYPRDRQKCDLNRVLQDKFEEVFAVQAQQFKGYLFQTHEAASREGTWTVAFQSSMDALRFTHAAQMMLMQTHWPPCAHEFCGLSLPSADGRMLFQGPRVCMAVHEASEYLVSEDESVGADVPRKVMSFAGPGVTLPILLTYAGRGGQVILSERAWDAVKPIVTQHPGAHTVISLGTHVVSTDYPVPMLLMEVMPNLLSKRTFQPVMTKKLVEPGYREAPDSRDPMTIVFAKVSKPPEVTHAEKGDTAGNADVRDEDITLTIQAFQISVSMYTTTARKLLRKYDGYECKEPEPGKFTLAFKELEDAITWACHLQEELMYLSWPTHLLGMQECREQHDADGRLIWRGLRVRIGMAYGFVNNKKPLNTGRADYFGVLANGAARVSALAAPGQVLVEAQNPPLQRGKGDVPLKNVGETLLYMRDLPTDRSRSKEKNALRAVGDEFKALTPEEQEARAVGAKAVGYYVLRGLDSPRLVYEAHSRHLTGRRLKPGADMFAPPTGVCGPGGFKDSSINSRLSNLRSKVPWMRKSLSQRSSSSLALKGSEQQQKQRCKPQLLCTSAAEDSSSRCKSKLAGGVAGAGSFGLGAPAAAGCLGAAAASGDASAANSSPRDLASDSPGFFSCTSGHGPYSNGSCSSRLQQLLPHSGSMLSVSSGPDAAALQYVDGSSCGAAEAPDGRRTRSWVSGQRLQFAGSRAHVEERPLQRGSSQELGPIAARSAHSELMGRQAAAAAAHYSLNSSALPAREQAGSTAGFLQAAQRNGSGLLRGGSGMSMLYDQLLGAVDIPPIQTAASPPGGGDWTETPSSMNGSPPPMSPFTTDGSHCSPMAVASPAAAALLPQQQHQQAVQQSLLRNLRVSASGELTTGSGSGTANSWQPANSSNNNTAPGSGGLHASCDSLSLALTSLDPEALSSAHSQLLAQQQVAQANMEQMVSGMRAGGSELSFSSSFDGKGGVKGLLSAGVSFLAGGAAAPPEQGALQALLKRPMSLLDTLTRMRSGHSSAVGGVGQCVEEVPGGLDTQLAAAHLQHGMVQSGSLPATPGSANSAGSWGGHNSHGSNALPSPGTVFANDIAQTFVNQRHNSVTSAQALAAPWGNRAALTSQNGSHSYSPQPPCNAGSPQQLGHGVAGSRGSSYTLAASSYSPQHFQHGVFSGWQQQQQQQLVDSQQQLLLLQQQHEGAAAAVHGQQQLLMSTGDGAAAGPAGWPGSSNMGHMTHGDFLDFEPSLNGGAIEALAGGADFGTIEGAAALMSGDAAGTAVDASDINTEFSLGMSSKAAAAAAGGHGAASPLPAAARGASSGTSADAAAAAASLVHRNMWASYEANQMHQLAEQQQQQLEQMQMQHQMQQVQVQQQVQRMQREAAMPAAAAELAAREQAFAAAAAAASRRFQQDARVHSPVPESYWTAPVDSQVVLQQLARRQDAAGIAVRAAAASAMPFTVPGDALLPAPQQLKLHLSNLEQVAAAELLAVGAGAAAGASIEVVGPRHPSEPSQPWQSSCDVHSRGAPAAYPPQQYADNLQNQQQTRDEQELSAYGGIWRRRLCQQYQQQAGDAAMAAVQQQLHSEAATVASKPQLQHSNVSSAAASPRSPRDAEIMGAAEEQQLLLVQAQLQPQQPTQRSGQLLQDVQQMAAMQQLHTLQQQQQQQPLLAVEGRHHSQTMGRLSPLGDLARSCSGSIKPASPAANAVAADPWPPASGSLGMPVLEQQQAGCALDGIPELQGLEGRISDAADGSAHAQ